MINITIKAKDLVEKINTLHGWYNPLDPDYTKEKIIRRALEKYYLYHEEKRDRRPIIIRWRLRKEQDCKCYYCRQYLPTNDTSIDHKIPSSRGGKNIENNLVACHTACNVEKNDMTDEEYKIFIRTKVDEE